MDTANPYTTDKYFSINKYKLYLAVVGIVFAIFLLPRCYYLLTFKRTEGVVAGYDEAERTGKYSRYTVKYPLIRFETDSFVITFAAPSYMYEEARNRVTYPVIYDEDNPTHAYAFTLLGFMNNDLTYLGVFFLVWTAFLLGPGFLPKTIRIKREKIPF